MARMAVRLGTLLVFAMFSGNENHVVGRPGNGQIGQVKRLGVDFAIHSDDEQQAKI